MRQVCVLHFKTKLYCEVDDIVSDVAYLGKDVKFLLVLACLGKVDLVISIK